MSPSWFCLMLSLLAPLQDMEILPVTLAVTKDSETVFWLDLEALTICFRS